MGRRPLAGSHPEEHYVPATRERMHLDKPTSHGGWPEGEYDPPVRDRIYGWYKKMKMMPEGDEPRMRDAGTAERRRDLQKGRQGSRMGYLEDQESLDLAPILAQQIAASPDPETSDAFAYVMKHPEHTMNVYLELYSLGEIPLARMVRDRARPRADEYVTQRGTDMRITESLLRRIIREEYSRLNEADVDEAAAKAAVDKLFRVKAKEFPGPARNSTDAVSESARSTCKFELKKSGVSDQEIASYVKKYAPGGNDMGEAAAVAKMNESQRGNDENSQHDNDTDPGDPMAKKLKEAHRRALKSAIMAEIRRRRSI